MTNCYTKLLQHPILSKQEIYSLIEEYQLTDNPVVKQKVLDKLIRVHFKLIYKYSTRFYNSHRKTSTVTLDDLVQVGMLAIEKAVSKFDLSSNLAFSTYLVHWLRGFHTRLYQSTNSTLHIPVHFTELISRIRKFNTTYFKENNVYPSIEEISEFIGKPSQYLIQSLTLYNNTKNIVSLNTVIFTDDGASTELLQLIENTSDETPDCYLDQVSTSEYVTSLLSTLNASEREIICLRFGLNGNSAHTLNSLAEDLGIKREAIRRNINNALAKLRRNSLVKS